MKASSNLLSIVVNVLLGASWALSFLGGTILFLFFLQGGIFFGLFAFFLGLLPGAFFVLLIEYFILQQEKFNEMKKQTQLLEELVAQS